VKGPRGAKGPQGAPGPAGVVAGYSATASNKDLTSSMYRAVDVIRPTSSGEFIVNAMATFSGKGTVSCWLRNFSSEHWVRWGALAKNSEPGVQRTFTLAMTGAFSASPNKQPGILGFSELCGASGGQMHLQDTVMTATRVTTLNEAARPRHRFVKPAPPARPAPQPRAGR